MRLHVRVIPRAKRPLIEQSADGSWRVKVTEPADGGRANTAVIAALAQHFSVPQRAIRIVHGLTSRQKIIEIIS